MSRRGIIISDDRDRITGARPPILVSGEKQLKYNKVFDIQVMVPATGPTSTITPDGYNDDFKKDVIINFAQAGLNLTKIPAYQYMVKSGLSNKWYRPAYYAPPLSNRQFPYYKIIEEITTNTFRLKFGIANGSTLYGTTQNIEAHIMTIRLILTFDKLER